MNTPAWRKAHDADGDFAIFEDDKLVCVTSSDTEWDERNAQLIASSPDILKTLEWLIEWDAIMGLSNLRGEARARIEAAIKKAKSDE